MSIIDNKYKVWHDNIIANGKNRILSGYKEKHHILPRCLGGKNNKENLVELTAREHFIVHMLLCKFTVGQAKMKMSYAFHAMCTFKNPERYNKINSRLVDKIRSNFKFTERKGIKLTAEHKRKISKANKGLKRTKETKSKMSKYRTGLKLSESTKQKIANSLLGEKSFWFGRSHKQSTKDKMSKKAKGRQNALGMKHTDNAKKRMSESKLGNKHTLGMICINKDGKTKMINQIKLQDYLNMGFAKGKIRRTQEQLRRIA